MIVDDDPAILRLVSVLLRSESHAVITATDGHEALALLEEVPPDLVILDLAMPGMDGRDFYRAARGACYMGPVIVCSAYGSHRAQVELGAEACLEKPFDPDILLDRVNALLYPVI